MTRRLLRNGLAVFLAALLAGPMATWIGAQQQSVTLPTAATANGLLFTTTTTLTSTAVMALRAGMPGTALSDAVTGQHNVYGYFAQNGLTTFCYVQVFDRFPVGSIVVGTTVPLTSFIVDSNSTRGLQVFPLPMFSITSALGMVATSTPAGTGACGTNPIVQFVYK